MSIIIFAGHHPKKPGACWEGFCEHDEALRWLPLLRGFFAEEDLIIGPAATLRDKTDFVNERSPLLAIDLHFNSAPMKDGKPVGKGSETLYYPGSAKGKAAAEAVQAKLSKVFPPDRGVKEGYYRLDPKRGADWFLARTRCTALILEPEFVQRKAIIIERRAEGVEALAEGLRAALLLLDAGAAALRAVPAAPEEQMIEPDKQPDPAGHDRQDQMEDMVRRPPLDLLHSVTSLA